MLDGAKFRLYSDADCKNEVYVKEGQDGYIVINRDSIGGTDHTGGTKPDTAVEMVSNANGTFNIYGLDSGTYYLKETDAPDGYRLLKDPIKLELKATFSTERDSYVKGDGATDKTLTAFDANANIKTFYNGLSKSEDKKLETRCRRWFCKYHDCEPGWKETSDHRYIFCSDHAWSRCCFYERCHCKRT